MVGAGGRARRRLCLRAHTLALTCSSYAPDGFKRTTEQEATSKVFGIRAPFPPKPSCLCNVLWGYAASRQQRKVMVAVQESVYEYEGSINKFLMDDKGSTLLAVYGLPPVGHADDPIRGVLAALRHAVCCYFLFLASSTRRLVFLRARGQMTPFSGRHSTSKGVCSANRSFSLIHNSLVVRLGDGDKSAYCRDSVP